MRSFVLLTLCCIACCLLGCQNQPWHFTVVDRDTGAPISGASVQCTSLRMGITTPSSQHLTDLPPTDASGQTSALDLPPRQSQHFLFQAPGYANACVQGTAAVKTQDPILYSPWVGDTRPSAGRALPGHRLTVPMVRLPADVVPGHPVDRAGREKGWLLQVVDARSGAPLPGVTVSFHPSLTHGEQLPSLATDTTDAQGVVFRPWPQGNAPAPGKGELVEFTRPGFLPSRCSIHVPFVTISVAPAAATPIGSSPSAGLITVPLFPQPPAQPHASATDPTQTPTPSTR